MPMPDGGLTVEEIERAHVRLVTLWAENNGRPPCRSCGSDLYWIHPALIANRSDTVDAQAPHTRQPTLMVYCQRCGLADHYVAWVLGMETLKVEGQ